MISVALRGPSLGASTHTAVAVPSFSYQNPKYWIAHGAKVTRSSLCTGAPICALVVTAITA
jgi:hypothetical protein